MTPNPASAPFPGFNDVQVATINRVARALNLAGILFLLLGVLRVALGIVQAFQGDILSGLYYLPEGALLAFSGLSMWTGAADAAYLRDVKGREKEHLVNLFRSIRATAVSLLILGCYVLSAYFVLIWM